MIRIGILDNEEEYAGKLAAYLNRENKGNIQCSAFTDEDKLLSCMQDGELEVLASTKEDTLLRMQEKYDNICYIWLTEDEEQAKKKGTIYRIYRYQSGVEIAKQLNHIMDRQGLYLARDRPAVAVYSPVGRCGKTGMLLDFVKKETEKKWLYVGLEDYGVMASRQADDLLYFVKERKEAKVLEIVENANGVIASPFTPFDTKTLNRPDMDWLLQTLKKGSSYHGMLFDISTGVLHDIAVLTLFDQVIVPFLKQEMSMAKKEKFVDVVKTHGLNDWMEKVQFLDMSNPASLYSMLG